VKLKSTSDKPNVCSVYVTCTQNTEHSCSSNNHTQPAATSSCNTSGMQTHYLQLQAKFCHSICFTKKKCESSRTFKIKYVIAPKVPGIRWCDLQELFLWLNKCKLTSFVDFGMRSEESVPGNVEPTACFSFTMLQHTGRFWSMIS